MFKAIIFIFLYFVVGFVFYKSIRGKTAENITFIRLLFWPVMFVLCILFLIYCILRMAYEDLTGRK